MFPKSSALRRLALSHAFLEFQFWFPVWMLFLTDRGFDLTTMVLADGVFRFTMVALEFPLGVVGDRIGRKRSYILISVLAVLTYTGITLIDSYVTLFGTWILWGVFWAMASGTTSAYTYEIVVLEGLEKTAVKIFGFMRAVANAAALVSLLLAGFLFEQDPALPFIVSAVFAFFALLIALTLPEIKADIESSSVAERQTFKQFFAMLHQGSAFFAGGVMLALALIYFWSPRILMQPLFIELNISPEVISGVYFSYSLAGVLAGLLADRIQGFLSNKGAIIFGFLMLWFGIILLAIVPGNVVIFFFPLLSFGYYLAHTVLEVALHHRLENRHRASFLSAISFIGGAAIIVTRPGLGILADQQGVQTAFLVWAILGVGLLFVFARLVHNPLFERPELG